MNKLNKEETKNKSQSSNNRKQKVVTSQRINEKDVENFLLLEFVFCVLEFIIYE